MEVVYKVKYKFKTNDNKTKNEIKEIFNRKLLNIIRLSVSVKRSLFPKLAQMRKFQLNTLYNAR